MTTTADEAYFEKPKFGVLPDMPMGPRAKIKFNFEDLLEACRERPGEDACIARFTKGGKKQTLKDCRSQAARIWRYLQKYRPLEDWELHVRPVPDTWCDREIWVCYFGDMTPEEAQKMADMRVTAYSLKVKLSDDKKADKEARAKVRAILSEQKDRRRRGVLG